MNNPLFDAPINFDFTATLAHEVRNPLVTIDLSLELLIVECKDDDLKIYMDIIKRSTERITALVNEMIKNHDTSEALVVNQSLHHLLDKVVEMAQDRIMLKNIMVCKEYDPTDRIVSLNRPKMKIALTRLSLDFIKRG